VGRHNFVSEGWSALHRAALDRGAEVDYYPPDYPELKCRSYIDGPLYAALVSPLPELANVDVEALGARSTLISRVIWRWIRRTANREVPDRWQHLRRIKTRAALLAAFRDETWGRGLLGSPACSASDPYSAVQFGRWLLREGNIAREPPIVPIIWGLAIIGAVWGEHLRCGVCKLCFRRSRPGAAYCDFHSQSRSVDVSRSEAYLRYRRGVLAKQRECDVADASKKPLDTPLVGHAKERLALPDALFPLTPVDGWNMEHEMLIASLEMTPRVVARASLLGFRNMAYEQLVNQLRVHIDPHEWDSRSWGWRVFQAENWFALEDAVAPGKRGNGKKTMALVAKAIILANEGRRNSQIASDLGVSPATVSRWATRYPDFKQAAVLRDCQPIR
jgi:hypothetical protein